MNREFLKGLGLEDEVIDKIMKEHGQTVNGLKEKANKTEALEGQIEDYKQQLVDRDKQLDELSKKAKGNEELTAQIDELKQQNKATKNEYEQKLQEQAFEHTLKDALSAAKVRNVKAAKALLDLESIKLDGDKLLGLDDQLKAIKESDSYLFEEEKEPSPDPHIVLPGNPNGGVQTKSIAEMSYQELADLKANDPAKFAELTKQ
ncbi:phage scaffolding protein [Salmonella enterica]|uniref:phage scaffolding protein n=1 Tax=Salmonella enterica TaxID=28901 RepID=UPI0021E4196F|nr:phage scaffolding protein [Salmonella enterica]